jgi:hypothetical protein
LIWTIGLFTLSLSGCGSSSDDSKNGYIQLYNWSSNAPGIHLTVNKNDDDDFDEITHSAITFTSISSRFTYESDTYDIGLAWQDQYNNLYDLENLYESQLKVNSDTVEFIVITEDIKSPNVLSYQISVRSDDEISDDNNDDVFNIRVLNMHTWPDNIDLYYSESDETFNEATLVNETAYAEMSSNQKLEQSDYIFYLSSAGSTEVLYTSQAISFPYASEYILVIRPNMGVGTSPFTLDKVSTTSIIEYPDTNAEASYRVYNGIIEHELLPDYVDTFDFHLDGTDNITDVSVLSFGKFSSSTITESGDYSMSLVTSNTQEPIISHHLLALNENTDKTIFFYLLEEAVDEDSDGDIDENGDGHIDEIAITVNSLIVDNQPSESIYSHKISVINLIDQDEIIDDFTSIKVYFVRSYEIIDTTEQYLTATFANPSTIELLNNTYTVYTIGKLDTSDIILSATELVLDEESNSQFMILEKESSSGTGYRVRFANQTD